MNGEPGRPSVIMYVFYKDNMFSERNSMCETPCERRKPMNKDTLVIRMALLDLFLGKFTSSPPAPEQQPPIASLRP